MWVATETPLLRSIWHCKAPRAFSSRKVWWGTAGWGFSVEDKRGLCARWAVGEAELAEQTQHNSSVARRQMVMVLSFPHLGKGQFIDDVLGGKI